MIVGINGFGRVGKNICKILIEKNIQIGLINDPMIDIDYIIYSLKYDTVFNNSKIIAVKEGDGIKIGDMFIRITHEREPKEIKWSDKNVKYVVEAS